MKGSAYEAISRLFYARPNDYQLYCSSVTSILMPSLVPTTLSCRTIELTNVAVVELAAALCLE